MKTPMKISAVRSLIVISLVAALVVAGTTMSWFTDEYNLPSAAEMVMGTLDFEITSPSVITEGDDEGQPLTWVAGKCKKLSWTFKNTGTKTAFFRARPDGTFTGYTYTEGTVTDPYDKITWSLPKGSLWKKGVDSKGKPDGWFYYCQPVKSEEEITLVLEGCLDEDAAEGSYEVKLKAESIQASHGAAAKEWDGWPGGQ
jgi:hypothetical protein